MVTTVGPKESELGATGERGARPGQETVLRISGLTKRYGQLVAVRDLDLELCEGEVFGLLGPNGSGKSTTLGMLLGHLRPTAGTIEIHGFPLARERLHALAQVGGLVEGPSFYPYLTGRQNLLLLAKARAVDASAAERTLETVGLLERADDAFGNYSHGLKQRLGIAGALLHEPQLVILDEPTAGLDPAGTIEIRELIPRIAAEGRTVLLASHLLHEVEQVCDRVAILQRGALIALGTVRELLRVDERVSIVVPAADRRRAHEIIAALPGVASIKSEGEVLVAVVADGDAAALNRALSIAGIYASRLEPASRSLEAVFLELTAEGTEAP